MAVGVEEIRRDAASLYSFVDSISVLCSERLRSPSYPKTSLEFFEYIHELGEKTKAYLTDAPNHVPRNPRLYKTVRQKIYNLRKNWVELHQFVKPTIDADTLNVPSPLVEAFTRRLRSIDKFASARFAVFHLHELYYLMVRSSFVLDVAEGLRDVLPHAPGFDKNLGLVGIPYSQAAYLHANLLIPHEIGHFVFERLKLLESLRQRIKRCLKSTLGNAFGQLLPDQQSWFSETLGYWAEELFCDLFAVWFVGPCYCFSYIELFDISTILDPSGSGFRKIPEFWEFSATHPADIYRLREQAALLDELGWWRKVAAYKTHYVGVLRVAKKAANSTFSAADELLWSQLSDQLPAAFNELRDDVVAAVKRVMHGVDPGAAQYEDFHSRVETYLHNGVVPSTVLSKKKASAPGGTGFEHPTPISVLNASHKVYLESLDKLMRHIDRADTKSVEDRVRWAKRLQEWTVKALEDYQLLVR